MRQWAERKTLAGALAMVAGAIAAQQGCGGDEPTTAPSCAAPCGAGQECVAGQCQCTTGMALCSGVCVATETDPSNCGFCGKQCAESEECVDGTCQCPIGLAACTSGCADINTDKLNCGQCNVPCGAAQSCVNANCVCPDNKVLCFGQCVDTTSNAYFCGDCETACNAEEYCNASNCEAISGCDQVNMDQYEGNDTCALARVLPQAPESAPTAVTVSDPTLHHIDHTLDADWYSILATEGDHICSPLSDQCYFVFDIAFTPPDTAAYAVYQMCVSEGACGASEICTTGADWNAQTGRYELSISWQGTCGLNDNAQLYVELARNGGQESCAQYRLEYRMSYTNETCL